MSASTPLVQIPSVTATQLVSSSRVPLTSGTLTLTTPPPDTPSVKLILTVGTLTVPLSDDSIVGTKNSLTYLFTFPLSPTDTGFVELTLPPSADDDTSETSKAATEFESVLVSHGFLKAGLVADADDMARAVKEAAARAADSLTSKTDARVQGREPVEEFEETRFSETTHSIANGAVEGSGKLAELSGKVAGAVSTATFEAGKWVGEKLGAGGNKQTETEKSLPREAVDQVIEATGVAALGVGQSAALVSSTLGESASRIVEHEHGQEAKGLVESARETAGNVGHVAVDATLGTSVVWQAGEAGVGAAKAGQMEDVKI